jgi:hypothetical protein
MTRNPQRPNETPAPNRRPRFPLGAVGEFVYHLCAPPASPAAVGEAQRSPLLNQKDKYELENRK